MVHPHNSVVYPSGNVTFFAGTHVSIYVRPPSTARRIFTWTKINRFQDMPTTHKRKTHIRFDLDIGHLIIETERPVVNGRHQ